MTTLPVTQALDENNGLNSIAVVRGDIAKYLPHLADDFGQRWAAAHADLSAISASPFSTLSDACNRTGAFSRIKNLGPKIVPLVVDKLAGDDTTAANLWAVLLYDILESDTDHCTPATGLLLNCARIVELTRQRNKRLAGQLSALIGVIRYTSRFRSVSIVTTETEYTEVCALGKSIMTPVMLAYLQLPEGPWFFLLYQIVHGEQLKARIYHPGAFLGPWEEFFNKGKADEAPVYTLSPDERYIYYRDESVGDVSRDSNGIPIINTSEQFKPGPRR